MTEKLPNFLVVAGCQGVDTFRLLRPREVLKGAKCDLGIPYLRGSRGVKGGRKGVKEELKEA